ncbi:DUF3108 domain-containing protein [Marinobacter pelagius]|uniref:DUF3108 domain-containing protein n=1 Tax=Marinobacter sp. C7 TaxID=2951363 RepID=UPI001EEFF3E6|nr:DUF3108 domain-containing protein [Marinobacter sp. C7]MCG7199997.1 DUF3108 domain-containing protein [Marinobacter sp. C7]
MRVSGLSRRYCRIPAFRQLTLLGFLLLPIIAAAQEPAPELIPSRVSYTATMDKGLEINGTAVRSLTSQGNGIWLYRTDVDSFIADIDESLVLKWESGRVIPLRYRYRLSGVFIRDREQSIDFDWSKGIATGSYRDSGFQLPLKEGALDPLGYQLQLRQDIKAGKREMSYQVIDGNNYDEEKFAVIDEEQVSTNGDTITLLKAEKVRGENARRQTLMWFDPQQDFLLSRLLQVEPDGSRYELRLQEAKLGN